MICTHTDTCAALSRVREFARNVSRSVATGFTSVCAGHAATSAAATTLRTGTPPRISMRPCNQSSKAMIRRRDGLVLYRRDDGCPARAALRTVGRQRLVSVWRRAPVPLFSVPAPNPPFGSLPDFTSPGRYSVYSWNVRRSVESRHPWHVSRATEESQDQPIRITSAEHEPTAGSRAFCEGSNDAYVGACRRGI